MKLNLFIWGDIYGELFWFINFPHADKPIVVKRAYMLKNILENMPIFIEDQTLIVGNQAKDNRAAPIFPEYAMDWVIRELDNFEKRDGDVFYITEDTKEELRSISDYWNHNTTLDKGLANIPPSSKVLYDLGIIKAEGNITSGDAHIAVDYGRIMKKGLKEYEERTIAARDNLGLTNFHNIKKYHFYEAILIVMDAIKTFAKRYSNLAIEMSHNENDSKRKNELPKLNYLNLT